MKILHPCKQGWMNHLRKQKVLTYAPIDNVAEQTDQGKACDNDYGDGDADMGYGGDDGQDL